MNHPNDNTNASQTVPNTPPASILIGIDWAENEHEFCAAMPDGTIVRGAFKQKRATIDQWIAELSAIAPNAKLDVCIETSTGGLINALMECPQVRIFPVLWHYQTIAKLSR